MRPRGFLRTEKATLDDTYAYARTNPGSHPLYGFALHGESRCPIEALPATDSARYEVFAPDGLKWSGDLDSLVCQDLADLRERVAGETLEPGEDEDQVE